MSSETFLTNGARWFLHSGIQEPGGGVARYYLADARRNKPVSTEITGYAVSTFVYLYGLTQEQEYLDRAIAAGRFLTRTAWRADLDAIPFELDPTDEGLLAYFFDGGIIVRGLLSVWRSPGDEEFLATAVRVGRSMARDHAAGSSGEFHPILRLPDRQPLQRDGRWSRSTGCYQLKAAMGWYELSEAAGDSEFRRCYDAVLDYSLRTYGSFLPGHSDRPKVMDRLHAFCYFLEGLLPAASDRRCAAALCDGIRRVAEYLREIGPEFDRSDVYAQLLRTRLYADHAGAVPLDRAAARWEADQLRGFQHAAGDPRIAGGFCFGRKGGEWLPFVNPVSTAFALQALAMWQQAEAGSARYERHLLI